MAEANPHDCLVLCYSCHMDTIIPKSRQIQYPDTFPFQAVLRRANNLYEINLTVNGLGKWMKCLGHTELSIKALFYHRPIDPLSLLLLCFCGIHIATSNKCFLLLVPPMYFTSVGEKRFSTDYYQLSILNFFLAQG